MMKATEELALQALRGCEHLLPDWCRVVEIWRLSRDLEQIADWGDITVAGAAPPAVSELVLAAGPASGSAEFRGRAADPRAATSDRDRRSQVSVSARAPLRPPPRSATWSNPREGVSPSLNQLPYIVVWLRPIQLA